MLTARQLSKKYGDLTALCDLDLQVGPGEIYCLLGANGAGKTTTINLFMNFIKPTSGEIQINGVDANKEPRAVKKSLSYIPENLNLYNNLSGLENLLFFAGLGGRSPNMNVAYEELLSVGLQEEAIKKRVSEYSKGMRQKVGIAIAKVRQADNLLLDEPTSGLDPQASNEFAQMLEQMRQDSTAILMTTHDLFRAKETGTHIGIMKNGVLVRSLTNSELSMNELEELYLDIMKSESYVADS